MKSAVIWDMDGVLVDTGHYHLRAWLRFWRELAVPFDEGDFQRTFGQRNDIVIPAYLRRETAKEEVAELSRRKELYFREEIGDDISLMDGVLDLLDALAAARVAQALATSAPGVNVEFILDRLNICDRFGAVVVAEDVRNGKPDPEIFLLAARKVDVEPHRCVVFEDSIAGVTAAKAAGMACLATLATCTKGELSAADLVVPELTTVTPHTVRELLQRHSEVASHSYHAR